MVTILLCQSEYPLSLDIGLLGYESHINILNVTQLIAFLLILLVRYT